MRFHDEMARIRAMLDEMARIRAMLNLAATAHAQVKWAVWDTPIPPDLLPSVASLNAAVDFMELAVFRAVTVKDNLHCLLARLPISKEYRKVLAASLAQNRPSLSLVPRAWQGHQEERPQGPEGLSFFFPF
eukprot:TRINITY_DN127_c0_g1_i1.p4 TRINITY_DN127_c0_g1~~TRINITY_DN127_c0_g1_i1.p4  ORF type:complete len:131 (-),score=29.82 TRINITY_DN127_c0_g1_i1:75-467(-)